jgi:WhiB family redox-sensing transcriptional regulator
MDPNLFFPEANQDHQGRAAKRICASCPVSPECLDQALSRHEFGVWGGQSEKQRISLRRSRSRRSRKDNERLAEMHDALESRQRTLRGFAGTTQRALERLR